MSAIGRDGLPKVCLIPIPVYGMKQAAECWNRTADEFLQSIGCKPCSADPCVYSLRNDTGDALYIVLYVDDLTIIDNNTEYRDAFVKRVSERFNITDEGPLADILNVQIQHNTDGSTTLHQRDYIEKLAERYLPEIAGEKVRTVKFPASADLPKLVEAALDPSRPAPPDAAVKAYQSLVGALLYCATSTRPDISYAVAMLCRAMAKPTPDLLDSAERILQYLVATKHLGITFERTDSRQLTLTGMSDSDWAVKHSTSGYIFSLCGGAVSWASKKQASIALSSTEAEIVAASLAGAEAVYLRSLLQDLGVKQPATELLVDNKGAVFSAKLAGHSHGKLKHVDRRHFFIRELVEDGKLRVSFVRTDDNVADLFTKPLTGRRFVNLRDKAMNIKPRQPQI